MHKDMKKKIKISAPTLNQKEIKENPRE